MHRILLGKGAVGRNNLNQIIEFIEAMQVHCAVYVYVCERASIVDKHAMFLVRRITLNQKLVVC